MPIKVVIFDLNGTVIRSPKFSDIFCEKFGTPKEIFLTALKEIMAKVRLPKAGSAYAYWKPYLDKWGIKLSEKDFFNFWFSSEKENTEIIELVKNLKQQEIKLFILSNNFAERTKYYDENFLFLKELFDKVYYSWQTGSVKSDPRCWQNILTENNLQPEECIYFDDSESNIKTAAELSIKSYLFTNADDIKNIIKS